MQDFGSGDTSSNLVGGILVFTHGVLRLSAGLYSQEQDQWMMNFSLSLRMRVYISILLCVVIAGTIGLTVFEHLPPLDALYFLIVTIATVGYGDIHPITPAGKILVMIIIITGVGCFVGVAANSIESIIDERERKTRMEKLNMIIGTFFSEIGTNLLKLLSGHDRSVDEIRSALVVSTTWSDADFARAGSVIRNHSFSLDSSTIPLDDLRRGLQENKELLLVILENPQMIEHDSFTPLLQALYHLTEELMARETLTDLPKTDYAHLSVDINRVYSLLMTEWLTYMMYLKHHYPYLFSLAMRRNPFDNKASVIVS
jgi:voltage-gated potassium channel